MEIIPSAELHVSNNIYGSENILPLYPYQLTKVRAIFVYGSDFRRQPTHYDYQFFRYGNYWIMVLFNLSVAVILYVLRRRTNTQSDISINLLDAIAIFYGGGNVHVQHKWEKSFFAIAMIGSFFFVSLMLANFSMHSITCQRFDKIDSFSKLAPRDIQFYISLSLADNKGYIIEMIK